MGLALDYLDGQTPLDEDEKDGLLIKTVTKHYELDELEQLNIEKAIAWTLSKQFQKDKILEEVFVKELHKKMFQDVWKWAGEFRKTEKNIGIKWIKIGMEMKYLLDDVKFWISNETYSPDEITIRFKHRLVSIHCFSNGNGRHSRLMADVMIESIFKKELFSWNNSNMVHADEVRKRYIQALKDADNGDYNPLIAFARG